MAAGVLRNLHLGIAGILNFTTEKNFRTNQKQNWDLLKRDFNIVLSIGLRGLWASQERIKVKSLSNTHLYDFYGFGSSLEGC